MTEEEIDKSELEWMGRVLANVIISEYTCSSEPVTVDAEKIDLDLISSSAAGIADIWGQIGEAMAGLLDSVAGWIVSSVETWISENVKPIIDDVLSLISNTISPILSDVYSFLSNTILPAINSISTSISSWISENVVPLFDKIRQDILGFIDENVVPAISGITTWISENVVPLFESLASTITAFISENVIPAISSLYDQISTYISQNVIPEIAAFAESVTNYISQNVIPQIESLIGNVSASLDSLTALVVNSFQDMVAKVSAGFDVIGRTLMGFTNAILRLPEMLAYTLQDIGTWIWSATPEWFRGTMTTMSAAFLAVVQIIRNPTAWFMTYVVQPVMTAANWLTKQVGNLVNLLWDGIQSAVKWVGGIFERGFKFVGDIILPLFKNVWDAMYDVSMGFKPFMEQIYLSMSDEFAKTIASFLKPTFEKMLKESGAGTPPPFQPYINIAYITSNLSIGSLYLVGLFMLPLWGQLPLRLISWIAGSIAKKLSNVEWTWHINLKPFGIGIETTFDVAKALGAAFHTWKEELLGYAKEIGRGVIYGFSIWGTQPMMKILNYYFRNLLPIELPSIDMIVEFARRMLPHEWFMDTMPVLYYWLGLYGYSDIALYLLFDSWVHEVAAGRGWEPKYFYITVKDRFGKERKVPLALIFSLPSASDVARMMVRDIITSLDDFKKLFYARGMYPEVAVLYYLLHFRYPPPERLWEFTMRGVSGLLWATISREEEEAIKLEIEKLGLDVNTFFPVSPAEITKKWATNQAETNRMLFEMFKTYMKWHDYARFPYKAGWPSDNLIYIDTLADLPTKIDQRWMVRWGLYELLKNKDVTFTSPIKEFVTKVIENRAASNITLDLTNFCRTLQATGIHPHWIPITAVAETMNTLTEERTLLRTGFMNLFKEGFWDVKALEKLLAGFIVASFKVAYFDIEEMVWKTGWINAPVMFLPPERKLLELRALMDRTLDVLRDIQRDITRGYEEWIIDDYNEYKEKLSGVIEKINAIFAADYKAITGVDLPDELKLKFVEEYYKPLVESLEIWRDVYTVRRIRAWTSRWLGWVLYRVAYGTVTKEDAEGLIEQVADYAKLTDREVEYLKNVVEILYGIAEREYAPTPSQLATISEYVSVPKDIIERVFEVRKIPEEWRKIWERYIDVRPISDDVRGLLASYRRALLYVTIPPEIENKVKEYANLIGFTDREWDILNTRVLLEELVMQARENMREYIPTPLTLANICEYLPEARQFFDEVMRAKRVPERWQALWAKYIDIKPLFNEIWRYFSRAEQLFAYFMIKEEKFKEVLQEVQGLLGFTDKEVEFILKTAEFERYRVAWREVIGDVDRMMQLAEYSPKARDYALGTIDKMIDALPIEEQTKQMLKEMWEQYIRVRPIYDEVRKYVTELINDFVEDVITQTEFEQELEALKKWGLDDYEIMFYKAIAGMKKARYLKRKQKYGIW